ncbi:MAG: DUF4277 domain-containing protein [Moorea sp. SIO2I5]|nr:DUF4277 domain-containing protein [Moorena sp. SIO2I5]
MKPIASSIRVQDLDHCGIVAGIIDQIGIVEQINQELGTHPQEKLSAGVAVKAMIINGLGLFSAPLYLFEKFFGRHCYRTSSRELGLKHSTSMMTALEES